MTSGFVQDESYAGHFGRYRRILDRVIDHDPAMFGLPKGAVIADLGCGFGGLLEQLIRQGHPYVIGVEPDPECQKAARARGLPVYQGTLTTTGLADESVDAAIVNQVFHHIDGYGAAVDEIARILKPGGVLCFMEPLNTPLRVVMDLLTFRTPLRRVLPPVQARYDVMRLEVETGLYPAFLAQQELFYSELQRRFRLEWRRTGWFFQFAKLVRVG